MEEQAQDKRVAAIRGSELVPNVNAQYSDAELIQCLDADDIRTARRAMKWAVEVDGNLAQLAAEQELVETRASMEASEEPSEEASEPLPAAPSAGAAGDWDHIEGVEAGEVFHLWPEVVEAVGVDVARLDRDRDQSQPRDAVVGLKERQAIKQAKRRLTLAANKAAAAS